MATRQKKELDLKEPLENKRWEVFCVLYAGIGSRDYFNNATACYMYAFGGQDETNKLDQNLALLPDLAKFRDKRNKITSRKKTIYNNARTQAYRLLTNVNIKGRCSALLNEAMSDELMDAEMIKVINQWWDIPSKVAAYREIIKVKQRVSDKLSGTLTIHWKEPKKVDTPKKEIMKQAVKEMVVSGVKWKKKNDQTV